MPRFICMLGVLLALLPTPGAAGSFVTIANAANITKCLGIQGSSLVMEDCIHGIGAEWNWTVQTASKEGLMQLAGYAAPQSMTGPTAQCLDEGLKFRLCSSTKSRWSWNPKTLQIQLKAEHKVWCLGLIGIELLMVDCETLKGTTTDDQNGYGAKAEQTWVLFPTDRPQIRILDRLKFPLRAAGRDIVDSRGLRVKLAGVNWVGAHLEMLVNNGLAIAPLRRIAKTVKYMGFNSVRLSYASAIHTPDADGRTPPVPDASLLKANPELQGLSALEVFDKTVEAITDEGLLVILNRHSGKPGRCCRGEAGSELWYGEGYAIEEWLDSLTFMARRYKDNPRMIGVDILNEPRLKEGDGTVPWWGMETKLTQIFGFRYADWRVAAAKGAVAVWRGNPDALVIVEGVMYGTNLQHVTSRPLKFAQDCLRSRVAYSSHEYDWLWPLQRFYQDVMESFEPINFYSNLKRIARKVVQAGEDDEGGRFASTSLAGSSIHGRFSYAGGDELVEYEHWVDTRNQAVFFLQHEKAAPVWVGEFGTSRKEDNAWWDYVLRYFRDYDVSWCYWPLDAIDVPETFGGSDGASVVETYGIFDPSRRDYAAVVGWKLQDLISIQRPAPDGPEHVSAPPKCDFELKGNLEAVTEPTGLGELAATMSWSTVALLQAALLFFLIVLAPCCCCCCLCFYAAKRGDDSSCKPWPVNAHEQAYLKLNSHMLDYRPAPKQARTASRGTIIDAQPVGPNQTRAPMPDPEVGGRNRGFLCCTKGPPRAPPNPVAFQDQEGGVRRVRKG